MDIPTVVAEWRFDAVIAIVTGFLVLAAEIVVQNSWYCLSQAQPKAQDC